MGQGFFADLVTRLQAQQPAPAPAREPAAVTTSEELYGNSFLQTLLGAMGTITAPGALGGQPGFLALPRPKDGASATPDFGGTTVQHGRTDEAGDSKGHSVRVSPTAIQGARTTGKADGSERTTAAGWVDGGVQINRRSTPKDGLDDDGEVQKGSEKTARIDQNGLSVGSRHGVNDGKLDVGATVGPNGVAASGAFENKDGWGGTISVGHGNGRTDVTVGAKGPGDTSISVSVHSIDQTEAGENSNPLIEGSAHEIGHTVGSGGSLQGGVDARYVGISAGAGESSKDRVAFQRSEATVAAEFDPAVWSRASSPSSPWALDWLPQSRPPTTWEEVRKSDEWRNRYLTARYGGELEQVKGTHDLDVAQLKVGDGLTVTHEEEDSKQIGGRVLFLSAGYGDRDLSQTQTSIVRTATGYRVRLDTSDADQDLANVGLGGVLGLAATSVTGQSRGAEFEVTDDEAGRKALGTYLQTGALPGATEKAAPWVRMSHEAAARHLSLLEQRADTTPEELQAARSTLFELSGQLNANLLEQGEDVMKGGVQGATYNRIGHGTNRGDHANLSLAGFDVIDAGVSEQWYDQLWRNGGAVEKELGYRRTDDWWFDPDEKTGVAVNPERDVLPGPERAAMVFTSHQSTSEGQRRLLDQVGADGMDPAMRKAWAEGKVHDGDQAKVSMALSETQLELIRTRLGPEGDDFAQLQEDALNGVRTFHAASPAFADFATNRERKKIEDGSNYWMLGDRYESVIAKVKSKEDFQKLTPDERSFFVASASQGAQYRDEWKEGTTREDAQPWRVMPLVLETKDPEERDRLLRMMFESIEQSSVHSTCAVTQLVSFLEHDGAARGLPADVRKAMLTNLAVRVDDGRVNTRAERIGKKLEVSRGDAVEDIASGLVGDTRRALSGDDRRFDVQRALVGQTAEATDANRADYTVDWLLAAERAGGSQLVADAIAKARATDPKLVETILAQARQEPWRQEVAMNLFRRAGVIK
jgi:hypothetical protein